MSRKAGVFSNQGEGARSWMGFLKIGLGTIFVYLGYREWRARPRPGQPTQLPHWLDTVEHMRPLAAAGTGFALYAANPKNLTVGVSAAVAFASSQLSKGSAFIVAAIYVLVSASTIVIPILGYFIAEDRIPTVAH
jgi:threonine/homoserine/homoserine lactone efflux protein